jgi:hypothetical protein
VRSHSSGGSWLVCDWVSHWSEVGWWVTELVSDVNELDNRWGSVVSRCCESLEAEAVDSPGAEKGNVRRWKPLRSNDEWRLSVCSSEL